MKIKINNVKGYTGHVTIQTDGNGVPLDKFWRNRLKDALTDNCIEVVKPRTRKAKQEKV